MKYYLIAGEASGDLHASNLMKALKQTDPDARFRCWGGDLMQAAGGDLVMHYRDLAFMGFIEVLFNLRTILRNLHTCRADLMSYRPDVLILVDYPGFNLRMARFAKKNGIRVFYYISPQLWAWRSSRVKIIRKTVERMFVILPFEKEFYSRFRFPVDFVGHPLLDVLGPAHASSSLADFRQRNNLGENPLIALLPGSRKQEIRKMLEIMLNLTGEFPGYTFVIAGAPSIPDEFYHRIMHKRNVHLVKGQTYELLHHSAAALVTSGTATLETALIGTPQVVCYKGSPVSYLLARMVIRVRFISLVNLILNTPAVTELIQQDLNTENLRRELNLLLNDEGKRNELKVSYDLLRKKLGGPGASAKAAGLMVKALNPDL